MQVTPFTPGTVGALPAGDYTLAGTRRFAAASPYGPAGTSIGGGHLHEASSGVHLRSPITPGRLAAPHEAGKRPRFPPVFSSPATPGWIKSGFGFYPGLRTPRLPTTHAEAETGHRALARVLHLRHQPNLHGASHFNSCTLTSHPAIGGLQHHLRIRARLASSRPSAIGSLSTRAQPSCSPPGVIRTLTVRRRCRSTPTYCLPS